MVRKMKITQADLNLAFTPGKPCKGCGKENHSFTDEFRHNQKCPQYSEWAMEQAMHARGVCKSPNCKSYKENQT